jgi:hypothetical protein
MSRIAMEVCQTKIGRHFHLILLVWHVLNLAQFAPEQNSIADAMVAFCVGSSWWNV